MVEFPLDPTLSKMLIFSERLGCIEDVATVVSVPYRLLAQLEHAMAHPGAGQVHNSMFLTLVRPKGFLPIDADNLLPAKGTRGGVGCCARKILRTGKRPPHVAQCLPAMAAQ
eukprot:scaffold9668_cov35-Tisochrysis_lutea.AAC.8